MKAATRRQALKAIAAGAATSATAAYAQTPSDGHASGLDVAPSSNFLATIPRKGGEPLVFTASLDRANLKATSGGWAREITSRQLPIATDIAGAHLFINPGGIREMHWHSSAEWAYVLAGHCQVVVIDPHDELELANYGPGDVWYFPAGHAHAIQALGDTPFHAVLAFNDGLYSEHGTYGLTDVLARLDPRLLDQHLHSASGFRDFPQSETYIMQGSVIHSSSPEAMTERPLGVHHSHRFRLHAHTPQLSTSAGSLALATSQAFPLSADMTTMRLRLAPGATQSMHWHPEANEWHYVVKGATRVTMFGPDKRLAISEMGPGDCAYIPRACAHCVQSIGSDECEVIGILDSGEYQRVLFFDWLSRVPDYLLASNLGLEPGSLPRFDQASEIISPV